MVGSALRAAGGQAGGVFIFSEVSLVVERYLLKFIDHLEIFSFLFFGRHDELGDDFFARDGPGSCLETLRVIRETCGT